MAFGNCAARSAKHVLLCGVSGNGHRAKIKSRRGHHFRGKKNHPTPPGKNVMRGTWGRVGGSAVRGWVCLNSKSGGYFFFSQEKLRRCWGRLSAKATSQLRRSPVWPVPWRAHGHIGRPHRENSSDSVHVLHQSHVLPWPTKRCNSPPCWLRSAAQ